MRKLNKKKVFVTLNNEYFESNPNKFINYLTRYFIVSIMKNYDITVTLNESLKKIITERYSPRKIKIIPNGLNIENYSKKKKKNFILYSGRLVPHKRLEDLIKAFNLIRDEIKENLIIIGNGPEKDKLTSLVNKLKLEDRIFFKKFLEKEKYYKHLSEAKLFVFPSVEEAFGVVVIEAMASYTPVIACDIIGPKDIIENYKNGILYKPKNHNELSEKIKSLLQNDSIRNSMALTARKKVEMKYSFNRISEKYYNLFTSILYD